MIPHLKKKQTPENLHRERKRELNLPLPENTKLLEKLSKMICSFSKTISSKSNLWLDKSGPIVRLPSPSLSVLLRLILMNALLFAIFPVQNRDFL